MDELREALLAGKTLVTPFLVLTFDKDEDVGKLVSIYPFSYDDVFNGINDTMWYVENCGKHWTILEDRLESRKTLDPRDSQRL